MPKQIAKTNTTGRKPISAEQKEVARITAASASASITRTLGPVLASVAAAIEKGNAINASILARLEAAEDDEEMDDMETAGGGKTKPKPKTGSSDDDFDNDDDTEDDDDDPDNEDEVDTNALDSADSTGTDPDEGEDDAPGHLNPDADKTGDGKSSTLEDKQGPLVKARALAKKWKAQALKLEAEATRLRAENTSLRAQTGTQATRLSATAGEATRKTLSREALGLLTKNGMDAADLKASGQRLSMEEVDAMFKNLPTPLDPENRIAMKRELQAAGIMVDPGAGAAGGVVRRTK